jgi:hypothetical protein
MDGDNALPLRRVQPINSALAKTNPFAAGKEESPMNRITEHPCASVSIRGKKFR